MGRVTIATPVTIPSALTIAKASSREGFIGLKRDATPDGMSGTKDDPDRIALRDLAMHRLRAPFAVILEDWVRLSYKMFCEGTVRYRMADY